MSKFTSRDGTQIACEVTGSGPPLVLVHGTTADHTRWNPVLPALDERFAVYACDRRGRGASGDGPSYAMEREFEDVAAVIDGIGFTKPLWIDELNLGIPFDLGIPYTMYANWRERWSGGGRF